MPMLDPDEESDKQSRVSSSAMTDRTTMRAAIAAVEATPDHELEELEMAIAAAERGEQLPDGWKQLLVKHSRKRPLPPL